MPEPVLSIRNLTVEFTTEDGVVHAVDGISYDVNPGETLGIVGESGSGKSVSMLSVLGLIPQPPGKIVAVRRCSRVETCMKMPKRELRRLRGGDIAMVFQDPMTSLNPVLTVGDQIGEAIKVHNAGVERRRSAQARSRAARASSASRIPTSATTSTRTSSPAGCASAR